MTDQGLSTETPSFAFGAYVLDPRTRRLLRGETPVPLTSKAFETLEVLVRSAGRTVHKDELFKRVWPDTFVQEETLAQNVSTIRKALGDTPDAPVYVLTVPREGYRFIAPVEVTLPRSREAAAEVPIDLPRPLTGSKKARDRRFARGFGAGIASGLLLAVLGLAVLAGMSWWRARQAPPPVPFAFEIYEPDGNRFSTSGGGLAISPDGRRVVFVATDRNGTDHLWLRASDETESRPLPGTENATQPFWSADSQSVAFFANGMLRRIGVSSDQSRSICTVPGEVPLAGTWSGGDTILFAVLRKGLFQVAASGGTPTPVSWAGRSCSECLWPSFLPDGREFLFTDTSATGDRGIYLGSLAPSSPRRLSREASSAAYASGYVFFAESAALVARRFDSNRLGVDVVTIADRVWQNPGTRRSVFSVSSTGVVAYREPQASRLQWVSRSGAILSASGNSVFHSFAVSHAGRVVAAELDSQRGTYDLWRYGPEWRARTRITMTPDDDEANPFWVDDETVVFARQTRVGQSQLYAVDVDRVGAEYVLLPNPPLGSGDRVVVKGDAGVPSTLAPDARRLSSVRLRASAIPLTFLSLNRGENQAQASPDGKWLAYVTPVPYARMPGGAVYVRPLSGSGTPQEIATSGADPRWNADGRELFFMGSDGTLRAQRMDSGRRVGDAIELCTTEAIAGSGLTGQSFDPGPDGQRFLVKVPARRPSIIVRSGWSGR